MTRPAFKTCVIGHNFCPVFADLLHILVLALQLCLLLLIFTHVKRALVWEAFSNRTRMSCQSRDTSGASWYYIRPECNKWVSWILLVINWWPEGSRETVPNATLRTLPSWKACSYTVFRAVRTRISIFNVYVQLILHVISIWAWHTVTPTHSPPFPTICKKRGTNTSLTHPMNFAVAASM